MSEKMINHDETRNKIISIAEAIISQGEAIAAYKKIKSELADEEVYSEEYKSKKLNEAWQTYLAKLEQTKTAIKEKLEEICEFEEENEKQIELDGVELVNALAIVEASKGKLAVATQLSMAESLAGKYLALDTIKKAIENHGGNVSEKFAEYLLPVGKVTDKLRLQTSNLEQSPDTAAVSLKALFDAIISYGEKLGLNLDTIKERAEVSLGSEYEAAKEKQMRIAMGLE